MQGFCPKCCGVRELTKHHVYPKRFRRKNNTILLLCRDCHDEIEKILPFEKLEFDTYVAITSFWLKGGRPRVVFREEKPHVLYYYEDEWE